MFFAKSFAIVKEKKIIFKFFVLTWSETCRNLTPLYEIANIISGVVRQSTTEVDFFSF